MNDGRTIFSQLMEFAPHHHFRKYVERHVRRDERLREQRVARSPQSARAEAMFRALDQLEAALPRDAELLVGQQPAYADDVLAGLRRLAWELLEVPRTR